MIEILRREGVPSQLNVEDIRRDAAGVLRRMGRKEMVEGVLEG